MKAVLLGGMVVGLVFASAGFATQVPAQAADPAGPSFSCTSASTPVEREICTVPALASADREMAALFALNRVSAFGTGTSNELSFQRQTLRDMRACGKPGQTTPLRDCLDVVFRRRNGELAVAAMMRAPAVALPVLRRIDPAFAPIAEATTIWAAEPIDAEWSSLQRADARRRITALLRPYVTDLLTKEDQSFGRSILTDPGADGVAVRRIEDLFLSDRHFAAFLNVLGPYIPNDGDGGIGSRRALPCAAVISHPALLDANSSVFGSTMDNFVLDNDCEQTLPALPTFSRFIEKLRAAWPDCDGTIRFAAYRSHQSAIDAARLGRSHHASGTSLSARKGVLPTDTAAARAELADYYQVNLGKSEAAAAVMATDALAAVLATAQECE